MGINAIIIDPDAARADITRIKRAIDKLEEAQNNIRKLQNSASDMTGQTGTAITEKCSQLTKQLKDLESNLTYTIRLIQSAVREYQEKDQQLANAFRRGGV